MKKLYRIIRESDNEVAIELHAHDELDALHEALEVLGYAFVTVEQSS